MKTRNRKRKIVNTRAREQKQREDDQWMINQIIKELRRRYNITDEIIDEIYQEKLEEINETKFKNQKNKA
ncbi:hypothetical protein [Mycoplasma procyoni]|uniref:hypothetical protein n=1 Tax=Mycoplasma procyoni TaxID=568784 RepID=UPI00197BCDC9|nr:hypothetical protein [Mycoplasma procyoni]MBN3534879.1 hypothetical protein [Mycoplasma procyoni]